MATRTTKATTRHTGVISSLPAAAIPNSKLSSVKKTKTTEIREDMPSSASSANSEFFRRVTLVSSHWSTWSRLFSYWSGRFSRTKECITWRICGGVSLPPALMFTSSVTLSWISSFWAPSISGRARKSCLANAFYRLWPSSPWRITGVMTISSRLLTLLISSMRLVFYGLWECCICWQSLNRYRWSWLLLISFRVPFWPCLAAFIPCTSSMLSWVSCVLGRRSLLRVLRSSTPLSRVSTIWWISMILRRLWWPFSTLWLSIIGFRRLICARLWRVIIGLEFILLVFGLLQCLSCST